MAQAPPGTTVYEFGTRPNVAAAAIPYVPGLPAFSAPADGQPETLSRLKQRWNGSCKDWESRAKDGTYRRFGVVWYRKTRHLVLPPTLAGGLIYVPSVLWRAAAPGRSDFNVAMGPTTHIGAAQFGAALLANGLPSSAGLDAMLAAVQLPRVAGGLGGPGGLPLLAPAPPQLPLPNPAPAVVPAAPAPPAPPIHAPPPAAAPTSLPAGPVSAPFLPPHAPLVSSSDEEEEDDPTGEWTEMLLRQGDIQPRNRSL